MQLPSAITKQSQIQAAINAVKRSLAPDAVHVRYEIGQDWSGEWSIFFRMVLTDDAAKHRLRDVAAKIVWAWRDSWTSRHGNSPVSHFQERFGAGSLAGTGLGVDAGR
jgi:hypothetical protein